MCKYEKCENDNTKPNPNPNSNSSTNPVYSVLCFSHVITALVKAMGVKFFFAVKRVVLFIQKQHEGGSLSLV